MYRTQHKDGREGEVGKRRRGEREEVEVKRMKEEEREGTDGERKITLCRVRVLSVTLELHSPTILFMIISGSMYLSALSHSLLLFLYNFELLRSE